jgi:Sec-independent protein secretion pathway component TatC
MTSIKKTTEMEDTRVKLSTLWVVVMFNIVFADLVGFVHPGALERIMAGEVGFELTQGLLLLFSIFLAIPIAMIFLSRVLTSRANRWANISAGALTVLFVIGGGSTTLSYIFFATTEIVFLSLIIWYAWTLPKQEAGTNPMFLEPLGEKQS